MPDVSPILGLPIAKGTDPIKQFPTTVDSPRTLALEKFTIPRFANAAARDTAIPAPLAGQCCYLTDIGQYQGRDAAGWYPIGGKLPHATVSNSNLSVANGYSNITGASTTTVQGGVTYNPTDGRMTVPAAGMYTLMCRFEAATLDFCTPILGGSSPASTTKGPLFARHANYGIGTLVIADVPIDAGGYAYFQANSSAAGAITNILMQCTYRGRK